MQIINYSKVNQLELERGAPVSQGTLSICVVAYQLRDLGQATTRLSYSSLRGHTAKIPTESLRITPCASQHSTTEGDSRHSRGGNTAIRSSLWIQPGSVYFLPYIILIFTASSVTLPAIKKKKKV